MKYILITVICLIAIPALAFMVIIPDNIDNNEQTVTDTMNTNDDDNDICKTYDDWVGQNIENIDLSVLGDRPYRVLGPNSLATMDFIPDRLNIMVDEDGLITSQKCG